MKTILLCAALLAAAPAAAGTYRLELQPKDGKIIRAPNGIHAVDSRTAGTLVRVIAPGLKVWQNRGTLRVLVMNLSGRPFSFGPDDVTLKLADGTPVHFMALAEFRDGIQLVQNETVRNAAVRTRINANLDGINVYGSRGLAGRGLSAIDELDLPPDDVDATARRLQQAVDSLLTDDEVEPQQAMGGYLMFELPKSMPAAKAEQPLDLIVSTGGEEHHFSVVLRRK
jgi:hypothetical protein